MKWRRVAEPIARLFARRSRRVSAGSTRAHVEFRAASDAEIANLAQHLKRSVQQLPAMRWVEVNALTRRVVFAYREAEFGVQELTKLVADAERLAGIESGIFDEHFQDHPGDIEPGMRYLVELLADLTGLCLGLGLTFSPLPALPFGGNVVALLGLLRDSDRLRSGLEERLGKERALFLLNLTSSVAQGLAQRNSSSFVDALHKAALLGERRALRRVWLEREGDLCEHPAGDVVGLGHHEPRPRPLPPGPIEEYGERAWFVSLSGFALSFLTTRSFQRATAALFGGFPRPARLGRDVFAARLGCDLSARGILSLDPAVLRRFDRIDCLVLQGELLEKDKFVIAAVHVEDQDEAHDARVRVTALFDSNRPLEKQRSGLWQLQPWELSEASSAMELSAHAARRSTEGALVLSLERADRVVAVVEVEVLQQTGVEELMASARAAQLRVVVAAHTEGVLTGIAADDVILPEEGLRQGIRRLQREGFGVCLVAAGGCDALPLADCGLGMIRPGDRVPWGAHLVCHEDLAEVRYVIDAMVAGKRVARQCVNIALAAATLGTLVSAGGLLPLTTRRVLFVVNLATMIAMANGVRHTGALKRRRLGTPRDPTPWHALDAEGAMRRLGSSRAGLLRAEVVRRELPDSVTPSAWAELSEAITDELFNPLAPLLAAGAGLSAVVGSFTDAAMVASVVGVNAVVGGAQRFTAERRIRRLTSGVRHRAVVRRDGREYDVDATSLVKGDIVVLATGDVVPADCRLIEAMSLEVDASTLTGESLPVQKFVAASFEVHVADRSSMLYEGTTIAAGRALGLVVAAGEETEAKRGAAGPKRSRAQGGVEQRLRALMDITAPVALVAAVGVIGGGLIRGRRLEDLVGTGVSLAVASVPEGLPLLATAAQLSAAERLSKRNALVRNPRCIEALGRVDVVCLDKTGTLTEGKVELALLSDTLQVQEVGALTVSHLPLLAAALRASPDALGATRADPLDEALRRAALQEAIGEGYRQDVWRRQSEISFESGRSYHATFGVVEAGGLLSLKGAPEVVLPLCVDCKTSRGGSILDDEQRRVLALQVSQLAQRGLRVLAVAERTCAPTEKANVESVGELSLLGFLAFKDPIRRTARAAIEGLVRAGVSVVMVTGDHPSTAQAIAVDLNLLPAGQVVTGNQLLEITDTELEELAPQVSVFARVTPAQKVRVIRALQRAGRVVAMAGDGANDAPALRLADVGIAVGEQSTSATRGAADVVLVDGRVETLVEAIAEGRAMWASVRDAVSILLGGNLGEIGFTLVAGLLDGRPPLNARQLLLVNLLTDVAPAMAMALRPPAFGGLGTTTAPSLESALGSPLTRDIAARAVVTAGGAGSAWFLARLLGTRQSARTVGLAALVGSQLGQTLRVGGYTRPVLLTSVGSAAVMAAIIQTPGVSHFFGCRPMGPLGWSIAVGASALATAASGPLTRFVASDAVRTLGQLSSGSALPRLLLQGARRT